MAYINSLIEQLRPVAREVLPSDPLRSVNLTNMNIYTRLYLRRIIERAKQRPFVLLTTDRQLARLFHVSLVNFKQWFYHNAPLPKVFRRARWFLQEMIRLNILEDLGVLDQEENEEIVDKPIQWPSKKTLALYRQRILMRLEDKNREPVITDLAEAKELIRVMQGGYSSSSSCSVDSDSTDLPDTPLEQHQIEECADKSIELLGFIGPPAILTAEQEPLKLLQNTHITYEKPDDVNSDGEGYSSAYD